MVYRKNRFLKKISIALACLFCVFSFVHIDAFAVDTWETPDWHEMDYGKIDEQLERDVKNYHIPGMAVIVVSPDEVLFSGIYGNCDSLDTPFLIGSMSKSFTALSVMQLVEQEKIDLDVPIAAYIDCSDYFKNPKDGNRITVRQLLNQNSGLDTYHKYGTACITDMYGKYEYANVNYSLLGLIIESTSGECYSDYVETHIFAPLGMEHTSATLEDIQADGLIAGYRNYFGIPVTGKPDYPNENSWSTVPAGYIGSSATDMGRYLQMYLNNGYGIISEESIHSMFYDSIPTDETQQNFYGMGWETIYIGNNQPIITHSGLVENYTSNMFLFPESEIGVIFLVNMNDYLVDNNMLGNIVAPLVGLKQQELSSNTYLIYHGMIDALLLIVFLFSIYPLVSLKKWYTKPVSKRKIIWDIIRHGIVPLVLLSLPLVVKVPWWVIYGFAKDVCLAIMISTGLLLLTGVYKLIVGKRATKRASNK